MGKRLLGKQPAVEAKKRPEAKPTTKKRPATHFLLAARPAETLPVLPSALVVNLARRPDRWEEMKERLCSCKLPASSFERFEAVDGNVDRIDEAVVTHTWNTAGNWRYVTKVFEGGEDCGYTAKQLKLTAGERGCAASHVGVWRRCLDASATLMVFEDDAAPRPRFVSKVRQALLDLSREQPDILYLGYTQAAPWRRKVSGLVSEAEYLWTTVGYILWPSGARKLLDALPVNQPVDNFMASLIARNELRGYAVTPEVVKQAKPWDVDNDVAHSDDVAWIQNCSS